MTSKLYILSNAQSRPAPRAARLNPLVAVRSEPTTHLQDQSPFEDHHRDHLHTQMLYPTIVMSQFTTPSFSFSFVPTRFKPTAAAVVVIAASIHLHNTGYRDWSSGADLAYVFALVLLFFSRETEQDERVQDLKLKAVMVGCFTGWATTGIVRFVDYLRVRPAIPTTMSAYDLLFIILLISIGCFHFWRWRDGRGATTFG